MRVACLQLNSRDDLGSNLDTVARLLIEAAGQNVNLAVLPEMFAFMHPEQERKEHFANEVAHQTVLPFLADQARHHQLTIVGGSLLVMGEDQRLRNCCPVFSPDGNLLATYDKIHLFDSDLSDWSYRESEQVTAGNLPQVITAQEWRIGLSICYDLRFPELFRHYAGHGTHILTVPSAFAVPTGAVHWEVLLRARAIENQTYVLAPAQIGTHPGGRKTFGHSMIVDPWGIVIAQAQNNSMDGELIMAELSLERLAAVRQQLPALQHRRTDLFLPTDHACPPPQ
ncbi:MAG: carbon-nitrogen hydrolase family protein [Pelovirga sp.]